MTNNTPRTDAAVQHVRIERQPGTTCAHEVFIHGVAANFARQLEQENAIMRAFLTRDSCRCDSCCDCTAEIVDTMRRKYEEGK